MNPLPVWYAPLGDDAATGFPLHALTLRCIGLALKAKREAAISSARRQIAYTNHRI
jgi:hypothetical protein